MIPGYIEVTKTLKIDVPVIIPLGYETITIIAKASGESNVDITIRIMAFDAELSSSVVSIPNTDYMKIYNFTIGDSATPTHLIIQSSSLEEKIINFKVYAGF